MAAIVICLDGVTVVLEPDPRFPTAYWIAGFVDYIYRTGHSSPALSAYFSWPGFFEVVAFIEHVVGSTNLMPVLKFWPVTIDLLSLVPMGLIVKRLHATWRAKWLALFIFTVGNWVGQDYFSPQSFNYLLYLFFLALLITYFGKQATTGTPGSGPAGHRQASPPRRFQLSGFTRKFTGRPAFHGGSGSTIRCPATCRPRPRAGASGSPWPVRSWLSSPSPPSVISSRRSSWWWRARCWS